MLENLCFSPIPKQEKFEHSSISSENKKIRGFNFMNFRRKEIHLSEIIYKTNFPIRSIRNFDFKQKKEKIQGILMKKQIKIEKRPDFDDKKKIKSFNFRQNIKNI